MLVVLGASENIARVARRLDEDVVFVDRTGSTPCRTALTTPERSFVIDWDEAALARFAAEVLEPLAPDAVVSVTEEGLVPAAVLSSSLGRPALPVDVVRTTRDKTQMRAVLRRKAPHLSVDHAAGSDEPGVAALLKRCGRAVVKPSLGTASSHVVLVNTLEAFRGVPDRANCVVEEVAEGREFSVESFSLKGNHQIIGIAETGTTDGFVEVSHFMPASLSEREHALISEAVSALLDAVGLSEGPAHTEVKMSGNTVKIIETHNRPGGGGIADLVAKVTGIDWRAASLGWPLGVRPAPASPAAAAAATVFFTAPPGRVVSVHAEAPDLHGVQVDHWQVDAKTNDLVGRVSSSSDRLGGAVLSSSSVEACRSAVRFLLDNPVVVTRPVVD
jgi:biotin carboxylase